MASLVQSSSDLSWFQSGSPSPTIIFIFFVFVLFGAIVNSFWYWGNEEDHTHDPLKTTQYDWNYILLIWVGVLMILLSLGLAFLDVYSYALVANILFYGGILVILTGILYHLICVNWKGWNHKKSSCLNCD